LIFEITKPAASRSVRSNRQPRGCRGKKVDYELFQKFYEQSTFKFRHFVWKNYLIFWKFLVRGCRGCVRSKEHLISKLKCLHLRLTKHPWFSHSIIANWNINFSLWTPCISSFLSSGLSFDIQSQYSKVSMISTVLLNLLV